MNGYVSKYEMDSVIHLYKGLIQCKLVQGLPYNVIDEEHFSISQTCQVTTFTCKYGHRKGHAQQLMTMATDNTRTPNQTELQKCFH